MQEKEVTNPLGVSEGKGAELGKASTRRAGGLWGPSGEVPKAASR